MALESQKIKLPEVKTVIAVGSGKGGTGKTFVATNLAIALAKAGMKVGIFDADISCPNVFSVLGITEHVSPTEDNRIFPIEKFGVKAISMEGLSSAPDEPIVWRGPIISKIIQQLFRYTVWGELDYLIIDLPTGTSDTALTLLQQCHTDGMLVVTTPHPLAQKDAARTIKAAEQLGVPLVGVLENMRGEIFGEGGAQKLGIQYDISYLGSIPLRKQISQYLGEGKPPILHIEEVELIFSKLVRVLLDRHVVQ